MSSRHGATNKNKTNFMTKLEIKGDTIIAKNELKRKWATLQFVDKLMAGGYNAANRIKFWGRMGALGGGIVGLFFGSAFVFIPSDGPRLVAGPLAAWICLGLAGAMAFGGLSALGAGIYNLGIARDSILQSGTAFTSGKFAVITNDSTEKSILARNIINRSTAKILGEDPDACTSTILSGGSIVCCRKIYSSPSALLFSVLNLAVDELRFTPKVPLEWKSFKLDYRYRETVYHIACINVSGAWKVPPKIFLDGSEQPGAVLKLVDDRREHSVEVKFEL